MLAIVSDGVRDMRRSLTGTPFAVVDGRSAEALSAAIAASRPRCKRCRCRLGGTTITITTVWGGLSKGPFKGNTHTLIYIHTHILIYTYDNYYFTLFFSIVF